MGSPVSVSGDARDSGRQRYKYNIPSRVSAIPLRALTAAVAPKRVSVCFTVFFRKRVLLSESGDVKCAIGRERASSLSCIAPAQRKTIHKTGGLLMIVAKDGVARSVFRAVLAAVVLTAL